MEVGESYTLQVTSEPAVSNLSLEFLSSNPGVASVDSTGKITALDGGQTTITGKYNDLLATCNVTVNPPEPEIDPVNGFVPFAKGGLIGGCHI